jgi:hypothetical protein
VHDEPVPADLIGTWDLVAWRSVVDDQERQGPMGDTPHGQLIYHPDGGMSVVMCVAERPSFGTRLFLLGTADQRRAAALTYLSYSGRWALEGDNVVHHVQYSLFPDWVGTDLVRRVTFEDDRLVLASEPEITGRGAKVVNRLVWSRARRSS